MGTLNSSAENRFVADQVRNAPVDSGIKSSIEVYIGLSDASSEGNWQWISCENFSYSNWALGEPNGGANENYGMIWASKDHRRGKMNDAEGTDSYRFILEIE